MQMKAIGWPLSVCQASVRFNRRFWHPDGILIAEWIRSSFLEEGGNAMSAWKKIQICDEGPNIIVLMIGENDIFLNTDPEGLAGHIWPLQQWCVTRDTPKRWSYANYCHACVHHGAFCTKWTDVKKIVYHNTWCCIRNRFQWLIKNWKRQRKSWAKSYFGITVANLMQYIVTFKRKLEEMEFICLLAVSTSCTNLCEVRWLLQPIDCITGMCVFIKMVSLSLPCRNTMKTAVAISQLQWAWATGCFTQSEVVNQWKHGIPCRGKLESNFSFNKHVCVEVKSIYEVQTLVHGDYYILAAGTAEHKPRVSYICVCQCECVGMRERETESVYLIFFTIQGLR